jgi:hypothetical protein
MLLLSEEAGLLQNRFFEAVGGPPKEPQKRRAFLGAYLQKRHTSPILPKVQSFSEAQHAKKSLGRSPSLRAGVVRQYKKNSKERKEVMSKPELKKITPPGVESAKAETLKRKWLVWKSD